MELGKDMDMVKMLLASSENESQSIHIESDILDPATSITTGGGETVFNIRKKGIIDKGSHLVFTVTGKDAAQRLTIAGGAFAMIQRATLRTSKGVVICQSDKINHFASMRLKFINQEVREKKLVVKTGTYECYDSINANLNGNLILKGDLITAGEYDKPIEYRLGTSSCQYQISLAELFPEAVNYQIPVYLLDGNLQLVITWEDETKRTTTNDNDNANITGADITDCKYVSDHLFFDGKVMAQMRAQSESKGLVLPYNDFNVVEFTLNSPATLPGGLGAGASLTKEFRTFMGLSNMRLKYMILQTQVNTALPPDAGNTDTPGNMINGFYHSRGSWKGGSDTDRSGGDHINVIINNKQYYPVDWDSDNLLYSELEDVYKRPYQVPRCIYTSSGAVVDQTLSDANPLYDINDLGPNSPIAQYLYYGAAQGQLVSDSHYLGINFSSVSGTVPGSGMKVGFTPIEFKFTRTFVKENCENLLLRAFCCVERMMVIKSGEVSVTYS
jgi:hypothetical protein